MTKRKKEDIMEQAIEAYAKVVGESPIKPAPKTGSSTWLDKIIGEAYLEKMVRTGKIKGRNNPLKDNSQHNNP